MKLLKCGRCCLVWADARVDPGVVQRHFETAYKDEAYFETDRLVVFRQLATIVSRLANPGANVLDIGGAKGHLMQLVSRLRRDVKITVHDISKAALDAAAERYGFATICGDVSALARSGKRYNVVVLSDVIYYEPAVRALWSVLSELVEQNGSVVIRVPNKLWYITARQKLLALRRSRAERAQQDVVAGFNPEHVTIMHRRYLEVRLRSLGFRSIRVMPSRLTCRVPIARGAERVLWCLAQATSAVSGGRLIITPAMIVVGRERASQGAPAHRAAGRMPGES
jgi:protein-L-isoaspartate O-methyltransferase